MSEVYISILRKLSNQFYGFLSAIVFLTAAFTIFSGQAAAQLSLDTNFNAGVTDSDTQVYVSRPLADGKVLIGGAFRIVNGAEKTALARLNADGSLDSTFNPNISGANGTVYEIVPVADGKFLIGGSFNSFNGTAKSGIVRINADGSLDSTFNPGGAGTTGTVQTIAFQTDGKILISGSGLTAYNGTARFSVIRLNADGTLDASFTSPFTNNQFVEEVDAQPDGKILIAGSFYLNVGTGRRDIARLNADGSLDGSFNPEGGGTDGNGIYAMTLQADGKILIGGGFLSYQNVPREAIARLFSDGSLDTSFNPNMGVGISGAEYFLVQPDGKILVAGGLGNFAVNFSLIRLNADGTLDNTFTLSETNSLGYHVSLQSDSKIFLTGQFTLFNSQLRRNLVKLNADGTLDNSFNASFSTFSLVNDMAQQADGKIVVGGSFNLANGVSRPNVARFNADGSLDASFNTGTGTFPDRFNAINAVYDVTVQPNGKIIIAGNFGGYNGEQQRGIVRLNSDGSLDSSFNSPFFNFDSVAIYDVSVQPDGRILVGGVITDLESTGSFLVRLFPSGSIDSSFSSLPNSTVRRIVRQADGKLLIGGSFTTFNGQSRSRIARINADGSLDTTFNPGSGANGTVLDIVVQPDGKILIAGSFTTFDGSTASRITRLNANGSRDGTFDSGTSGVVDGTIWSIALQPDGKIIIGGTFSAYNVFMAGVFTANRLARLNSNGTLQTIFDPGFGNDVRFSVRRLLLQTDGNVVVGGTFKTFNGVSRNSLLRLRTTASRPAMFDFDGDGKSDVSVFRPSNGVWYLNRSTQGFTGTAFGTGTDKIVPSDFDGDGKTDIAVFRDGNWYWLNSSNGAFNGIQFGQAGDVPVSADYTGDGRAELAVYRNGAWFTFNLANNQFQGVTFGAATDKAVPADFDADGKTDFAVYRDGTWYVQRSSQGFTAVTFGAATDTPTVGDYDGDGRADQAVYRSGTWYVLGSAQGFYAVQFGAASDIPVPADYDGDGKTDIAVFRGGVWYLLNSQQGFTFVQFGDAADKPIPTAFLP